MNNSPPKKKDEITSPASAAWEESGILWLHYTSAVSVENANNATAANNAAAGGWVAGQQFGGSWGEGEGEFGWEIEVIQGDEP